MTPPLDFKSEGTLTDFYAHFPASKRSVLDTWDALDYQAARQAEISHAIGSVVTSQEALRVQLLGDPDDARIPGRLEELRREVMGELAKLQAKRDIRAALLTICVTVVGALVTQGVLDSVAHIRIVP